VQCFLTKTCTGDTLVAPVEIDGMWEQCHDWSLLITASKWCSTRKVLSTREFPEKETYLGMSSYCGIPASVWDLVRSCISYGSLMSSLFIQRKGRPLGIHIPYAGYIKDPRSLGRYLTYIGLLSGLQSPNLPS